MNHPMNVIAAVARFVRAAAGLLTGAILALALATPTAAAGESLAQQLDAIRTQANANKHQEVLDLADRALAQHQAEAEAGQGSTIAEIHFLSGASHYSLGDKERAVTALRKAAMILEHEATPPERLKGQVLNRLAYVVEELGGTTEVEGLYRRSIESFAALGPEGDRERANSLRNLGRFYDKAGRDDEAEAAFKESLRLYGTLGSDEEAMVDRLAYDLGAFYTSRGRPEEASLYYSQALALREVRYPDSNQGVLDAIYRLIWSYQNMGRYDLAVPLHRRAKVVFDSDPEHPDAITVRADLAYALLQSEQIEEAEVLQLEALEIAQTRFGMGHKEVGEAHYRLAFHAYFTGDFAAAADRYRKTIALFQVQGDPDLQRIAGVQANLADVEAKLGHEDLAVALYRESLAGHEPFGGPALFLWRKNARDLIQILERRDAIDEISALLERYVEAELTAEQLDELFAFLRDALGRAGQAGPQRRFEALGRLAVSLADRSLPAAHRERAAIRVDLAWELDAAWSTDEPVALLRQALDLTRHGPISDPALTATAGSLLGMSLLKRARFAEAVDALQPAIAYWQVNPSENPGGLVQSLATLAEVESRMGQNDLAQAHFDQAARLVAETLEPNAPAVITYENARAKWEETRGNFAAAEEIFRARVAHQATVEASDPRLIFNLHFDLVEFLKRRGRYGEALEETVALAAHSRQAFGESAFQHANVLALQGGLKSRIGDTPGALELYREAVKIRESLYEPANYSVIIALMDVADAQGSMGAIHESIAVLQDVLHRLEVADRSDDPIYAQVLRTLARRWSDLDKPKDAEELVQRALAIDEADLGDNANAIRDDLSVLVMIFRRQGRHYDAAAVQLRLLSIIEPVAELEPLVFANALISLAHIKWSLSEEDEALKLLERAHALKRRHLQSSPIQLAEAYRDYGSAKIGFNRPAEAEATFRESIRLLDSALGPNSPSSGLSYVGISVAKVKQGDWRGARVNFDRAFEIVKGVYGADYPGLRFFGDILPVFNLAEGKVEEAVRGFRDASARGSVLVNSNSGLLQFSETWLALIAAEASDWPQVLEHLARARAPMERNIALASSDHTGIASRPWRPGKPLIGLQVALLQRGADAGAPGAWLDEAFEVTQLGVFGGAAAAVASMSVRFGAGDNALGHRVRERQDATQAWRLLNERLLDEASKPLKDRNTTKESAWREQMAALLRKTDEIDLLLAQEFPEYALLAQPGAMSLAETQSYLRDGEALIYYRTFGEDEIEPVERKIAAAMPGKTLIWVVKRTEYHLLWVDADLRELEEAVKVLRGALDFKGTSIPPFDTERSFALYRKIFAPAEPYLEDVRHVIVVPDGSLQSLPLGVLVTEKPPFLIDFADYAQVSWLARRYAMTTLPSVASLRALRGFAKATHSELAFIGFGNPVLDGTRGEIRSQPLARLFRGRLADVKAVRDLAALPDTENELKAMAASLGAGPESIFLGSRATETQVKSLDLAASRVVAFATHGLLAGELDENTEPALVLTPPAVPSEIDDGLLTASEIARLRLDADLVVLSACNTAAADASGTEGLSGLAKAFFFAGARALLVSHWPVDSLATTKLTTGLFDALDTDPGIGRAEALRRSVAKLMVDPEDSDLAHPYFWAPFVVVGEGG